MSRASARSDHMDAAKQINNLRSFAQTPNVLQSAHNDLHPNLKAQDQGGNFSMVEKDAKRSILHFAKGRRLSQKHELLKQVP